MKPEFRFATRKAIDELAKELNLPNDPTMQDWAYEVSNPNQIDNYLTYYHSTTDEDKKFVLFELIVQATADQPNPECCLYYWNKIKSILTYDFRIHEYTIAYWAKLDGTSFENCLILSPLLRQLQESSSFPNNKND